MSGNAIEKLPPRLFKWRSCISSYRPKRTGNSLDAKCRNNAAYSDAIRSSINIPHPAGRISRNEAGGGLITSKALVARKAHNAVSPTFGTRKSRTVNKKPATSSSTKCLGSFAPQCFSAHSPKYTQRMHDRMRTAARTGVCQLSGAPRAVATNNNTAGMVPTVPGTMEEFPNHSAVDSMSFSRSPRLVDVAHRGKGFFIAGPSKKSSVQSP